MNMDYSYKCNSCNRTSSPNKCLCYLCDEFIYVCDNCRTLLGQNMFHVKMVVERTSHFRENHLSVNLS